MNRFTVRLNDELNDMLEQVKEHPEESKAEAVRRLIREEADPRIYKINTGFLDFVFNSSGIKKPPELVEAIKELQKLDVDDALSTEQKDELALELIKKERSGEILNDKEREFVNKWLDRQKTQRKNRDIMKKHDVEEKEIKAGEETEAFWEEELIEKLRQGKELTGGEKEHLKAIGEIEEDDNND